MTPVAIVVPPTNRNLGYNPLLKARTYCKHFKGLHEAKNQNAALDTIASELITWWLMPPKLRKRAKQIADLLA